MEWTYRLAGHDDKHDLTEFRWLCVQNKYGYGREQKRSFKKEFLHFLNDDLHDQGHHCLMAFGDGVLQGTVYWKTIDFVISYDDPRIGVCGYLRYLEARPQSDRQVLSALLDRMIKYATKEGWLGIYAYGGNENEDIYLKAGFTKKADELSLLLV